MKALGVMRKAEDEESMIKPRRARRRIDGRDRGQDAHEDELRGIIASYKLRSASCRATRITRQGEERRRGGGVEGGRVGMRGSIPDQQN